MPEKYANVEHSPGWFTVHGTTDPRPMRVDVGTWKAQIRLGSTNVYFTSINGLAAFGQQIVDFCRSQDITEEMNDETL